MLDRLGRFALLRVQPSEARVRRMVSGKEFERCLEGLFGLGRAADLQVH